MAKQKVTTSVVCSRIILIVNKKLKIEDFTDDGGFGYEDAPLITGIYGDKHYDVEQ